MATHSGKIAQGRPLGLPLRALKWGGIGLAVIAVLALVVVVTMSLSGGSASSVDTVAQVADNSAAQPPPTLDKAESIAKSTASATQPAPAPIITNADASLVAGLEAPPIATNQMSYGTASPCLIEVPTLPIGRTFTCGAYSPEMEAETPPNDMGSSVASAVFTYLEQDGRYHGLERLPSWWKGTSSISSPGGGYGLLEVVGTEAVVQLVEVSPFPNADEYYVYADGELVAAPLLVRITYLTSPDSQQVKTATFRVFFSPGKYIVGGFVPIS